MVHVCIYITWLQGYKITIIYYATVWSKSLRKVMCVLMDMPSQEPLAYHTLWSGYVHMARFLTLSPMHTDTTSSAMAEL